VNGKTPEFKHWGWLDPAGGLLTTVHDLAQVNIRSQVYILILIYTAVSKQVVVQKSQTLNSKRARCDG
jgi:hypothetical protein